MDTHRATPDARREHARHPAARPLDGRLLDACARRAADADRDGTFFAEDLADLRAGGALGLVVPARFGGHGLGMAAAFAELARLAAAAPATALGLNMHLMVTGMAADRHRGGDPTMDFVLEGAARGRLQAAGVSEPGNDFPAFHALCRAERAEGGYRFSGQKMFTTMAPAWDDLYICGLDDAAPEGPRVVHAILAREAGGATATGGWDVLGMRATHSLGTRLDAAWVPGERILHRAVPGAPDPVVVGAFTWGLLGFATVYLAIARRALAIATAAARDSRPLSLPDGRARHPGVQHTVADMAGALWAGEAFVAAGIAAWESGAGDDADWLARLLATKRHAVETAWRVVDDAVEVTGGAALFRGHELERLFRDARCGRLHPANAAMTREIVGKTVLGLPLDVQPRWG